MRVLPGWATKSAPRIVYDAVTTAGDGPTRSTRPGTLRQPRLEGSLNGLRVPAATIARATCGRASDMPVAAGPPDLRAEIERHPELREARDDRLHARDALLALLGQERHETG